MKQNMQSVTEQKINSLQYIYTRGSLDGQAGRLDRREIIPKTLKSKLNLKRNYQARVHSRLSIYSSPLVSAERCRAGTGNGRSI
jgi:hypothetical protein